MSIADKTPTPWWKSSIVVALAAAIIPLATFIQGTLQATKELDLQQKKQKQELRLAYANIMVEGGVASVSLLADFLAETEDDEQMKVWAKKQQAVIRDQMKAIEERNAINQAQTLEAQAKQVAAERKLAESNAELARLQQAEKQKQLDHNKLVDRIKNGEISQLLAAAAEQQHKIDQAELILKKEAAAKLAIEQEAALLTAKSQTTKASAKSIKSQELLTGRLTPPQELFREQRQMTRPQ